MTNDQIYKILKRRTEYEDRIKELGGTVPPPWPWDTDGMLRNVQLLERVEELENPRLRRLHA